MAADRLTRRLAAIVAADVAGYSRLTAADEEGTYAALRGHRAELVDPKIEEFRGRIANTAGDGLLIEFPSVVEALRCAAEIQKEMRRRNSRVAEDRRIEFRMGINLGDVIEDNGDLLGDGVNVAARLEGLADAGGICVSGTAMDHVVNKIDLGFEDLGKQRIKNIETPVRIYRVRLGSRTANANLVKKGLSKLKTWQLTSILATAVIAFIITMVWWQPWLKRIEPALVQRMAFPLPDKPSIAVLPFDNLSGNSEEDYLSDGITENIISSLSKVSQILVIARNSTFVYKGKAVKVQRVAEDLGVRYVLEGSVQRDGPQLRVTAQLIDAVKGYHLWSARYDRRMEHFFAVQDDITREIVVALHVKFTEGEEARVRHRWTSNLRAWELAVRAYALFERFTKEDNARARALFQQALKLDSKYAWAFAKLGFTHFVDASLGYSEAREKSFEKAHEIAKKTLEMDDKIADGYVLLSLLSSFKQNYDAALEAGRKAVALDPNYPQARASLARVTFGLGQWDETITFTKSAIRIHPHHPSWYLVRLGKAYYFKNALDKAVAVAMDGLRRAESDSIKALFHRDLAFFHMEAGRVADARRHMALGQRLNASTLSWYRNYFRFKNPAHLERMLTALHKAGLPE